MHQQFPCHTQFSIIRFELDGRQPVTTLRIPDVRVTASTSRVATPVTCSVPERHFGRRPSLRVSFNLKWFTMGHSARPEERLLPRFARNKEIYSPLSSPLKPRQWAHHGMSTEIHSPEYRSNKGSSDSLGREQFRDPLSLIIPRHQSAIISLPPGPLVQRYVSYIFCIVSPCIFS
jgi:hypothetical protein